MRATEINLIRVMSMKKLTVAIALVLVSKAG